MSFVEGLIRFTAGGLMILLVSLIGKNGNSKLAGLVMMFPTITIIGYFFLAHVTNAESIRKALISSLIGLPLSGIFFLVLYVCIPRLSMNVSLGIGIAVWLIGAVLVMKL